MLFLNLPLLGQTVRPLIDENVVGRPGQRSSGKIEYFNDSLQTLYVVLEAKSFTVSETGDLSYRTLDHDIHLKLSAMSFKIPPRQNYYIFYEASADKLPAWFVIYAAFSGFRERTPQGFQIQVQLPHTIYLLPKRTLQKAELSIVKADYLPETKRVVLRVANSGDAFGRVLEANVKGGKNTVTQGGFPIFPNSQREVEMPWDSPSEPRTLRLRLDRFSLERDIRPASH